MKLLRSLRTVRITLHRGTQLWGYTKSAPYGLQLRIIDLGPVYISWFYR